MKKILQLHEVWKTYHLGNNQINPLAGINLEILQGEYIAITGRSGSGKSTLLNVLGCLDLPTKGQYLLDGIDVGTLNDDDLSTIRGKKIGFIFQSFHLLPQENVIDNIALPMFYQKKNIQERKQISIELAEKVGLGDRIHHKPQELSGGQCQRVAIARALANNPLILLADEPTGNLDTRSTKEILEVFDDLHQQGCTIILVTHEPDVAERAEHIIELCDGRVVL